jgi:pimeloyl-ACP methyl ester carboxylesterase
MIVSTAKDFATIRPSLKLYYQVHKSSTEIPYSSSSKRGPSELIVFHHGHTGCLAAWPQCAAELLKLRPQATCLLLDCRGAGLSDRPVAAANHTIELLAEDVVLLVDQLFSPSQRFAMVGHSMGGLASLALALHCPERLPHVVAVAPAPASGIRVPPEFIDEQRREREAARAEGEAGRAVRRRMAGEALVLNNKTGLGDRRATAAEAQAAARRVQQALDASDDHHLHLWRDMERIRLDLGALRVPTLMVAGAADSVLRSNLQDYTAMHRSCSLHVFSGVAHDVPTAVPRQLAEVVAGFLEHGLASAQLLHRALEERRSKL